MAVPIIRVSIKALGRVISHFVMRANSEGEQLGPRSIERDGRDLFRLITLRDLVRIVPDINPIPRIALEDLSSMITTWLEEGAEVGPYIITEEGKDLFAIVPPADIAWPCGLTKALTPGEAQDLAAMNLALAQAPPP